MFNDAVNDYTTLTAAAGTNILIQHGRHMIYYVLGARVPKGQVDTTSRTGYSLVGSKPKSRHAQVSEYYQFDWEYAQTPEQTSWIASSWVSDFCSCALGMLR